MMTDVVVKTEIDEVPLYHRGKVRDVYDLDDSLLVVATDRISAFDCVIPTGIPDKGRLLTQMSLFWFDLLSDVTDNHLISADVKDYPEVLQPHSDMLAGRSMLVKKAKLIEIECIVRGYISGSFWKAYQKKRYIASLKEYYRQLKNNYGASPDRIKARDIYKKYN